MSSHFIAFLNKWSVALKISWADGAVPMPPKYIFLKYTEVLFTLPILDPLKAFGVGGRKCLLFNFSFPQILFTEESAYFSLSSQSTLNFHQKPSHHGTHCKQEAWATILRQKMNTNAIALPLSGEHCANRDRAGFGNGKSSSSTRSLKVHGFTPGSWISTRETHWAG